MPAGQLPSNGKYACLAQLLRSLWACRATGDLNPDSIREPLADRTCSQYKGSRNETIPALRENNPLPAWQNKQHFSLSSHKLQSNFKLV